MIISNDYALTAIGSVTLFFMMERSKKIDDLSNGLALLGIGLIIFGSGIFISGLKSGPLRWRVNPPTFFVPIDESLPIHPSTIVELTNKEREKENLPPLKESNQLSYLAYLRAKAVLENDDFSHALETDSPTMTDLAKKIGYGYTFLAENLAKDFNNPEDIVTRWMTSGKHKENILSNKYKETGAAVVKGEFEGKETIVVVQIFGEKLGLFELIF